MFQPGSEQRLDQSLGPTPELADAPCLRSVGCASSSVDLGNSFKTTIRATGRACTAEATELLPAYVSRYAHNDYTCTFPMLTVDVVSLLLGDERTRGAVTASVAVVLLVLLRKILAAGASVAVTAPLSVRCPKFSGQGSNRILIREGTGSSAWETETIHTRV